MPCAWREVKDKIHIPLSKEISSVLLPRRTFPKEMIVVFMYIFVTPWANGCGKAACLYKSFSSSGGSCHDITERRPFEKVKNRDSLNGLIFLTVAKQCSVGLIQKRRASFHVFSSVNGWIITYDHVPDSFSKVMLETCLIFR